jgi:threonine dehydrogenase-like Zn-dependent dehydrogenase
MRAVVFKGVGQIAVEDRPVPKIIQPTDAILKVKCSAICGSDLHWYRGHMSLPTGFIPGHEFVGVVNEVGNDVKDIYVGDTVVVGLPSQHCCY